MHRRGNKYIGGKAIIDDQLNIKNADSDFWGMLGEKASDSLSEFIHPLDVSRMKEAIGAITLDSNSVITLRMVRCEGGYRWMLVSIKEHSNQDRTAKYISIDMQDIAEYKDTIDILKGSNDRYTEYLSLMEYLMIAYDASGDKLKIFMVGSHQHIDFYDGTLTEWHDSKLVRNDIDVKSRGEFEELCKDIRRGTLSFEHELKMQLLDGNGKKDWCMVKGKTIRDSIGESHVIATMSVVNPTSKSVEEVSAITGTMDAGTDLLNKRTITNYARKLIESKPDYPVTIAIIDVDNFKEINDRFGHMFGDQVLSNVASIIKAAVEGRGISGRIGGDEMVIVLEDFQTEEEIRGILRTIRDNVARMLGNDEEPNVTCSIGSASYPSDAEDYDTLFNIADKVLYLAKEKGRNRYIIFHKDIHGGYINGKDTVYDSAQVFYKYRKAAVVNEITRRFYKKGVACFQEIGYKIALTFCIDSIYAYEITKYGWNKTVLYGNDKNSNFDGVCFEKDEYLADFREDGVKVIDNVNSIERKAPSVFEALNDMGIHQAVQTLVKEYGEVGSMVDLEGTTGLSYTDNPINQLAYGKTIRIVSFNRIRQLKKWSDTDIMYLTILGNMIGMGLEYDAED